MNKGSFLKNSILIIGAYFMLSYPLFYYAYKYHSPDVGGLTDCYSYFLLYDKWDFYKVESPFNMRLISSFFIYLFNKTNLFYDSQIAYKNVDQKIFFSAILVNYISVVFTCTIIFHTIYRFFSNYIFAFGIGLLYLLGFGTIFFALTPLADSLAVLLMGIVFYFYLKRSKWIVLFLFMAVFQREYILLAMGLVALCELLFNAEYRTYNAYVFFFTILFFAIYFFLRKTFFYTPMFSDQISPLSYMVIFLPEIAPYLRQTLLIQNLLFIYWIVFLYNRVSQRKGNLLFFFISIGLFLQMVIIGLLAKQGNNTGRIFYISTPIILFYLANEVKILLGKYLRFGNNI